MNTCRSNPRSGLKLTRIPLEIGAPSASTTGPRTVKPGRASISPTRTSSR